MGTDEYLRAFVSNIGPLFATRLGAITNRLLYQLSYLGPLSVKDLFPRLGAFKKNFASNLRCSRSVLANYCPSRFSESFYTRDRPLRRFRPDPIGMSTS